MDSVHNVLLQSASDSIGRVGGREELNVLQIELTFNTWLMAIPCFAGGTSDCSRDTCTPSQVYRGQQPSVMMVKRGLPIFVGESALRLCFKPRSVIKNDRVPLAELEGGLWAQESAADHGGCLFRAREVFCWRSNALPPMINTTEGVSGFSVCTNPSMSCHIKLDEY